MHYLLSAAAVIALIAATGFGEYRPNGTQDAAWLASVRLDHASVVMQDGHPVRAEICEVTLPAEGARLLRTATTSPAPLAGEANVSVDGCRFGTRQTVAIFEGDVGPGTVLTILRDDGRFYGVSDRMFAH